MGKLSLIRGNQGLGSINYNTGTIFDYHVGNMQIGVDGKWYINGGFGNCMTGWSGKGGLFKSTLTAGLMMNSLGIYKDADGMINDTEDAISRDLDRIKGFSPYREVDMDNQLDVLSGTIYDIDETSKYILEICQEKEKHRKDFIIETPFLDGKTLKKRKAWLPTFILIDSFSELDGVSEKDLVDKEGITGKKTKTVWMVDGGNKTLFIRRMRKICERYGICIILTAHIGKNIEIDTYGPTPKQLQHMNQSDRLKRVGSEFEYLTGLYMQTTKSTILQDSNKKAFYKNGDSTPDVDINEVTAKVVRGKNNISGTTVPYVVSQTHGYLDVVTNYNYLKTNGMFGLNGSLQRQQPSLLPEVNISRNTIRELSKSSYELRRALELTAQYLYLSQSWNKNDLGLDLGQPPAKLYEEITKSNSLEMNDVLNSRGYWTYDTKDPREYMSIVDVLIKLKKEKA